MDTTDEMLMASYQTTGNESALAELVRRYADPLLGFLVRMTSNRPQAEDLFQETFLRVHRKADTFRSDGVFKPWLYSIASHLAVDSIRRTGRAPASVSLDAAADDQAPLAQRLPTPDPDPAAVAASAEQQAIVRAALDILPPRQKATLVLAYFEGLTHAETARAMGCSIGSVKKQLSRALATLAKKLERDLGPNDPLPGGVPAGRGGLLALLFAVLLSGGVS